MARICDSKAANLVMGHTHNVPGFIVSGTSVLIQFMDTIDRVMVASEQ